MAELLHALDAALKLVGVLTGGPCQPAMRAHVVSQALANGILSPDTARKLLVIGSCRPEVKLDTSKLVPASWCELATREKLAYEMGYRDGENSAQADL